MNRKLAQNRNRKFRLNVIMLFSVLFEIKGSGKTSILLQKSPSKPSENSHPINCLLPPFFETKVETI